MSTFMNALESTLNKSTTNNGAITNKSSMSKCVDFFAQGGSFRFTDKEKALQVFIDAFNEDKVTAVRLAFMFRDIRGGQGQRQPFRDQFKWLSENYPHETARNLVKIVPEYGRWDDLYCALTTRVKVTILNFIKSQLDTDSENMMEDQPISILGKWLKRINTSSSSSRRIAHLTKNFLGMSNKEYRKLCAQLNSYLNVAENRMSAKQWDLIDYSSLPGQCLNKHKKAFQRNDATRYQQFVQLAQEGKVKVNASTLYPYQVIEQIRNCSITNEEAQMLWMNLTNQNVDSNALVVADTSGSMRGLPIIVCLSLAIYFAERATGPYKDSFITFSRNPVLQKIKGDTIVEKVQSICELNEMNTNLELVFNLVLQTAIQNNLQPEDMVNRLYIISDMEFDECALVSEKTRGNVETFYETMSHRFEEKGYKIPGLVFWNVNGENVNNLPVTKNTKNACMISGFSPSILQYFNTSGELPTAEEMMMTVVNSERYNTITFN